MDLWAGYLKLPSEYSYSTQTIPEGWTSAASNYYIMYETNCMLIKDRKFLFFLLYDLRKLSFIPNRFVQNQLEKN